MNRQAPLLKIMLATAITFLAFPLSSTSAFGSENHYFVMMFAYKNHFDIRQAHTYAAFVHMQGKEGQDARVEESDSWNIEQVTISWLPESLPMCLICRPVVGHNYTLSETFQIGLDAGADLYELPTIEVSAELFENAVAQVTNLNSGGVEWVTLDRRWRPAAVNCLHAVSDVNLVSGPLYSGTANGVAGSSEALQWFSPYQVPSISIPDWLPSLLGVDQYPVNQIE